MQYIFLAAYVESLDTGFGSVATVLSNYFPRPWNIQMNTFPFA